MAENEGTTRGAGQTWFQRVKQKLSGSVQQGHAVMSPPSAYVEQRKDYSPAVKPMEDTEETRAHNAAIDKEYHAEIERRKQALIDGDYAPRYLLSEVIFGERFVAITNGARPLTSEVDWDTEMTMLPGRRTDVTKASGKPRLEAVSPDYADAIKYELALKKAVAGAEKEANTPRAIIGSRDSILAAVGYNEQVADQVEESARKHFGVEDLDAPFPQGHEHAAPVVEAQGDW